MKKIKKTSDINWNDVDATTSYKQYIELFRLFWYAAQKTQYYASDDSDGNDLYRTLSGQQLTFSPPLWQGEPVTIISLAQDLAQDDITFCGATKLRGDYNE